MTDYARASSQVSWSDVHEFVLPKLEKVGDWPLLGTPAWCLLEDRDPVKWAAMLDGGQHWALYIEGKQLLECQSSSDISAAEDWTKVARISRNRADFLDARPWSARSVRRPQRGGWMR